MRSLTEVEACIRVLLSQHRTLVPGSLCEVGIGGWHDGTAEFRTESRDFFGRTDIWRISLRRTMRAHSEHEAVSELQRELIACGCIGRTPREKCIDRLMEVIKLCHNDRWEEAWELGQDALVEVGAAARGQAEWQQCESYEGIDRSVGIDWGFDPPAIKGVSGT